jgi:hypothetical protein
MQPGDPAAGKAGERRPFCLAPHLLLFSCLSVTISGLVLSTIESNSVCSLFRTLSYPSSARR